MDSMGTPGRFPSPTPPPRPGPSADRSLATPPASADSNTPRLSRFMAHQSKLGEGFMQLLSFDAPAEQPEPQTFLTRSFRGSPPSGPELSRLHMQGRSPQPSTDAAVVQTLEAFLNQTHKSEEKKRKDAAKLVLLIMKSMGQYTYEHCTRLVDLALDLAREMGYQDDELYREVEYGVTYKDVGETAFFLTKQDDRQKQALAAFMAGLNLAQESMLHDIGKVKVPPSILYKPGALTVEEVQIMQQHPIWGAQILQGIPEMHHAIPVVRHHHERWDGHGYPDGLRGEEIPLAARIVSVVDAFDAMVADRPYRQALSLEEARSQIADGAGTQFDPQVATAFVRIVGHAWRR